MTEEMTNYYTILSGKLASVRDSKLIPTVLPMDGGMVVLDKMIKHIKEQDRKYADLIGELLIKNKRLEEALTKQAPSHIGVDMATGPDKSVINPAYVTAKGSLLIDDPDAYKSINVGPAPKSLEL